MIKVRQISTNSNDFKNIKRVYNTVFPQNELLPLSLLKMRAKAGKAAFIMKRENGLAFSTQSTTSASPIFSFWQLILTIMDRAWVVRR